MDQDRTADQRAPDPGADTDMLWGKYGPTLGQLSSKISTKQWSGFVTGQSEHYDLKSSNAYVHVELRRAAPPGSGLVKDILESWSQGKPNGPV